VSGCFPPGATYIEVPVGSPVLADRERASMAVSEVASHLPHEPLQYETPGTASSPR
jgi:hypothetical protein